MAIDPIAVTGGAATNMPTSTDVSAQTNAAAHDGSQRSQAPVSVGTDNSIDIFSYTNLQNQNALPIDALNAEGKAQYFANPNTLGEEVLNFLEGFHQRMSDQESVSAKMEALKSSTETGAASSTGPASMMPSQSPAPASSVDGTQATGQPVSSADRFELVLDIMEDASSRLVETNIVSNTSQEFTKSMGILMRGQ